jgi:enamine deaminase RidA (YjgF/YER057c/UK114 family)
MKVIKILGMVNCRADFLHHPKVDSLPLLLRKNACSFSFSMMFQVINGCSDLFREIWGEEHGIGARSAVGMGSLPDNIPVEIECIFQLNGRPKQASL